MPTPANIVAWAQLGAVLVQLGIATEQEIAGAIKGLKGQTDADTRAEDDATAAETHAILQRIIAACQG